MLQGCVFTQDINRAIAISDAMETGTVQVGSKSCPMWTPDSLQCFESFPRLSSPLFQINAAPARGPDHFPFQGFRDSGIGSQGITNSLEMMVKTKSTVINLEQESYAMG